MSDSAPVVPIRPGIVPCPDVEREFIEFCRENFRGLAGAPCAVNVVFHNDEGGCVAGCYTIPDLPAAWFQGQAAAELLKMAGGD